MAKPKTILYVEDDAVILTAYRTRLEQAGFTVVPAYDGIQALGFLRDSEPDLILLDLQLPKLDGEEVLKFLYGTPRFSRVPVIILSTNSNVSLANEHLVEKAAEHLLKKDCDFQKLLKSVEKVLTMAEAAKNPVVRHHKTHACPVDVPRILSFLQLNIRDADPASQHRTNCHPPAPLA